MKIKYFDYDGNLLAVEEAPDHVTKAELENWLNDSNLEQPGPDGWEQFEIID